MGLVAIDVVQNYLPNMTPIPLEDNFTDVIGKAQRGLKIDNANLAARAGITDKQLNALLNGTCDDQVLRRLAPVLHLDAEALRALAHCEWYPQVPSFGDGFALFNSRVNEEITVNNFLVWDPVIKEAAIFDTGTNADVLLAMCRQKNLTVRFIFLTHTHIDHVQKLPELVNGTDAEIHVHANENFNYPSRKTFSEENTVFTLGYLSIRTLNTWGHSPGMVTYVISGLPQPLAIVGDSIFSGSMGGSRDCFQEQLCNNREKIMALPDSTVLAPGHGPLTTVGFEKRHNPFFAGK